MKSILITGGTGSLGNALVPKLLKTDAKRICILSRSEKDQAVMRRKFPDPRMRWFIGDVRDLLRVYQAISGCDAVIHAAALKRIEVGEYNPGEMIKTNTLGTDNIADAARVSGVRKAILVSTDKAVAPVSPYGQSKALAEALFRAADGSSRDARFSIVRYGNVWLSNGSVVTVWRDTETPYITDPDCTRFFMTLDHASDFVLQALRDMKGGETFVPTLPAYRLGDVAEAMGIKPTVIGLPSHEKKHEIMTLGGPTSEEAERMTIEQIRSHL